MKKILFYTGNYSRKVDLMLLLLRIIAGSFMITHGIGKAERVIAGPPYEFSDPIGLGVDASLILAAFSEFICAILVIIGLFTRLAAIPVIITMAVAAFIAHADDGFYAKELPLFFLTVYFVITFLGAGRYSLDKIFSKE